MPRVHEERSTTAAAVAHIYEGDYTTCQLPAPADYKEVLFAFTETGVAASQFFGKTLQH